MPKRAKSDDLTGGSGDVNPKWLKAFVATSTNDVAIQLLVPLPVQRLNKENKKSLVLEIFKIRYNMSVGYSSGIVTAVYVSYCVVTTKDFGLNGAPKSNIQATTVQQALQTGPVIDYIERTTIIYGSSTGAFKDDDPTTHELTDEAGHGVLVATDQVYITLIPSVAGSSAVGTQWNAGVDILYRWKEVTLEEYVGIVQSQQ